jgi:hypothetical protein
MSYQDKLAAHPGDMVGQEMHRSSRFRDKCELAADDAPAGSTAAATFTLGKESWGEA